MLGTIHSIFTTVVHYAILGLEIIGAALIVGYTVHGLLRLLQKKKRACREAIADGITLGLSFLLASEVLHTIIAPAWTDIGMTCAILAMRAGIAVLLNWEKKHEDPAKP